MDSIHARELEDLNTIAGQYDHFQFDDLMRAYLMRTLAPYLVPGNALEMGCYHGEFTQHLAKRFDRLTVVDAAAEFLAKARSRVPSSVKFIEGLFETFETDEQYDNLFLMHTLEHLIDPVAVLRRAGELVTPNGRLFLVCPNANAPSRQIAVKMGLLKYNTDIPPNEIRHGHRRVYALDTLEADARAAGLQIESRGGVFFKALANFQFDKLMGGDVVSMDYMEGCYQLGMHYPDLCASIYLVCRRPASGDAR